MDFHGPRNVWNIQGELGSCRASKQLISRRLQMQNRLNQMLHDTQLGYLNWWNWCKRKMLISTANNSNAWLVWIHGIEVAGRSTFAAFAIYIHSLQIFPTQTLGRWFSWGFRHLKKTHVFHGFHHGFCGTLWHDGMTSINLLLKPSRLRTNLQAAQHSELWTWQAYMHQMSNSLRRLSRIFSTDLIAAVPVARSCD